MFMEVVPYHGEHMKNSIETIENNIANTIWNANRGTKDFDFDIT
jgi:hypothetical protein